MAENTTAKPIEVTAHDLPLICPRPNVPKWADHPRVFLDITHDGKAVCSYCSAHYVLKGELPKGAH